MLQNQDIDRISIQVGLSGYSFKVQEGDSIRKSGWLGAERVFTTPELQKRYVQVELSVFTPKFTLVPSGFHSPEKLEQQLSEVVEIEAGDDVSYVDVPEFAAVLVYSNSIGETLSKVISETVADVNGLKCLPLPEIYYMLRQLPSLTDYNRILASYMDGYLYLTIAQGRNLMLCNVFQAPDFTTAQYFIFLAMKKLQLNTEVSTICFRTPLDEDEEMSLYRYFKNVEQI